MTDIAIAFEGLLDATLEEIEATHAFTEIIKNEFAGLAEATTALNDEFDEKLKALRDRHRDVFERLMAEQAARIQRIKGEEPPPADVVRFPKSQKMAAE